MTYVVPNIKFLSTKDLLNHRSNKIDVRGSINNAVMVKYTYTANAEKSGSDHCCAMSMSRMAKERSVINAEKKAI